MVIKYLPLSEACFIPVFRCPADINQPVSDGWDGITH